MLCFRRGWFIRVGFLSKVPVMVNLPFLYIAGVLSVLYIVL